MNKRLLILDGIGGATLGRDLYSSVQELGVEAVYIDLADCKYISFYKARSAYAKMSNKKNNSQGFYQLPKVKPSEVRALLETSQPDVILVIGFCFKFISPSFLRQEAKVVGAELYLYDTDSCNFYSKKREFTYFIQEELPIYNHIFSFSKVVTNFLQRLSLPTSFAPFGAHLLPNKLSKSFTKHDVTFVGSADLRRVFLLEPIAEHVVVFGNRWKRNFSLMSVELKERVIDRTVWGEELQTLLNDSKIVLNITRTPFYGVETGVNLRIFEALALGCFVLTDYCDELAELFEPGVEIETFKSAKELKEKVDYYLHHDKERQAIAARGFEKIKTHYTWFLRSEDMLKKMQLLSK